MLTLSSEGAPAQRRRAFQKILVGFDGSDTGYDSLALATALAKASGAHVVVAYVYEAALANASMAAAAELHEHAEATLASARGQLSQGLGAEFQAVASNSPAGGLLELASRSDADLIVLGSRGLGPATRIALGSVSHRVMTEARCAVAIAPRGYREHGGFVPQAIGVSGSGAHEAAEAVARAKALAASAAGRVHILASVGRTLSSQPSDVTHPEEIADELIERSGSLDLIIVASGFGAYDSERENLARVIERAHCPVLIVPSSQRG